MGRSPLTLFVLFVGAFLGLSRAAGTAPPPSGPTLGAQVVIPASVQLLTFGGDRFLAADIEAIRVAALGTNLEEADASFRIRSHRVVAQLNPCHEDNFHIGNAALTWGGNQEAGTDLLRRAAACRSWDEIPAFFYGFNLQFFRKQTLEARRVLETAAERSVENAAAYRKLAIMIQSETFEDERMALAFVKQEYEKTTDPRLRIMLERRVVRLSGLVLLRDAQRQFEAKSGHPLTQPQELLASGMLENFPPDPTGLGFEFRDGRFHLSERKVAGMEGYQ